MTPVATDGGAVTCEGHSADLRSRLRLSDEEPIADELRRVIDAWPTLPEPVCMGIVAMIEAAKA